MIETQLTLKESLQEYFGFDKFKGDQEAIINSLLQGKDTFVIMPTGGGKSLCYQLPALLSEGVAIVISPLIALMKNQVDLIRNYSSKDNLAHFLNSSLNKTQIKAVKADIVNGDTKLLYVAPETLTKQENIDFFKELKISFVAVDEAHCISEWGHDFRPEYRRIRDIIEAINDSIPIIALTATATPKVQSDILKTLDLQEPNIFISSFNRSNLYYEIRQKKSDSAAVKSIIAIIKQNTGKSGIVYVTNRKTAEDVAQQLVVNGIKAAPYHAGLDNKTRTNTQDRFLMQDMDVIVATIAFGMGIDKPDIRFVIHFDVPKSLENYYQETGRAGRDGLEGKCYTFFSHKDVTKIEKLMKDKTVAEKERSNQLIDETVAYCETSQCRRKYILHYFGEDLIEECNKMCDNCSHPKAKSDVTAFTTSVLNIIKEVKENHVLSHIVNILKGKKSNDVIAFRHDKLEVFGMGKDKDDYFWSSIIRNAMIEGLLKKDIEQYGLLKITDKGKEFLQKPYEIAVAVDTDFDNLVEEREAIPSARAITDPKLYKMLEDLRKQVAKASNLPPYVIFQDISLEEMAIRYPISEDEFCNVTGVSKGKYSRYGKKFSDLIKSYVETNEILRPEDIIIKSVVKKSNHKIKIIQCIDQRLPLEDISRNIGITRNEVIEEIDSIVHSGTKVNLDYYLNELLDEYLIQDIYEYFKNSPTDSLDEAFKEFKDDDISVEDIQLVRIKFVSEMGN
jgi:ATP-dependent DNA helicase RecQ